MFNRKKSQNTLAKVRARETLINADGQKSQDKKREFSNALTKYEEISPLLINYHKPKNVHKSDQKAKKDNITDYFKVTIVSNTILTQYRKNFNQ